jgi:ABC-2 type transport system permease protein
MVLTVGYLGDPDMGAIFCAYCGSFLMAGAYLSVGNMTSALTRNQVISFILSVVVCLFLVLAGWPPITDILSGWAPMWVVDVVSGFSFMPHFSAMERGVIDLRDLMLLFFSYLFHALCQRRGASKPQGILKDKEVFH